MGDRPDGAPGAAASDDHDRTAVFRRQPGGGMPEEIEKLYRPRRSEQGAGAAPRPTRRMPPVEDIPDGPRSAPGGGGGRDGRGRGRVYDGSGRTRRDRELRRRRRRTVVITVLVLLVLLPTVFYLWADSRLRRVEALPDYEGRPENQPGTTYMIVGSDSREGLTDEDMQDLRTGRAEGKRTDTIMVLYVPTSGRPSIISVPRDSRVEIPEIGENKINAAFSADLGGGPSTLVRTFEQESGVRIDHYVEIGFAGFVDIVDAVGGVEMCPEEPMEDPKAGLDIEAGCQDMDGTTALGYVRTRASVRADLDRIQRQREFFSALISKATDTSTLVNPFRSIPLVTEGTETFDVDEGDHLSDLASMALAMREDPATTTIPVGSTPNHPVLGSVVEWDETLSQQMFTAMQNGEEIPESALQD
ncbi:LCP family protein [Marinitenerispora sediminis]|uniref:Transcriptional regulator n=1 Tax=Marinitenerispora sediminis TaxID=1931232 RepID=A0A368T1D7_9ACTN|nr:LCP family protein [Marinitenerispora sediminis]RCV49250.1 transcriptional regulator [Marinitenerispora sediminis]RCV51504.1 transcriptional regulator [Marinitenerispora sediminis]RCV53858.1 transcriptional regulator [Marinitenerispora sediminis]